MISVDGGLQSGLRNGICQGLNRRISSQEMSNLLTIRLIVRDSMCVNALCADG